MLTQTSSFKPHLQADESGDACIQDLLEVLLSNRARPAAIFVPTQEQASRTSSSSCRSPLECDLLCTAGLNEGVPPEHEAATQQPVGVPRKCMRNFVVFCIKFHPS